MCALLRRSDPATGVGCALKLHPDDEVALRFGPLWEFLAVLTWPDGSAREPGSLTIFFQDGLLKACISDKDAGLVGFVSARRLDELLEGVCQGVGDDSIDWRRPREAGGGRPRK